jgi:AcrR family transcriptional regulator
MPNTTAAPEPQEPLDARVERSKAAVLATTFQLMTETGVGGVSIDEVSRRSGVAKTTIYRHWPSRSALLLDACARLRQRTPAPDTGSLEGDVAALASYLAEQLKTARWPTILPSIIDAAERDADLAALHASLQAGFSAPYGDVLARAKKRGEAPKSGNAAELAAHIMGPIFFRRWFSREPLDRKFVRGVVEAALLKLRAAT